MASSFGLLPSNGVKEAALLSAFLSGNTADESRIPSLLCQGVECKTDNSLPGTNNCPPDSLDIDGYAMLLSQHSFETHIPRVFHVAVGGRNKPASSKSIEQNHGFRFVGSANCNIHLHVSQEIYGTLMWNLRACQPGSNGAPSRTNIKTYPVETFLEALRLSGSTSIIVNCYGLEDQIELRSNSAAAAAAEEKTGVKLKPSMRYIQEWADSSTGFRLDVGAVWLCNGSTPYVSVPGSPTGAQVFPIGVPLQSLTHLLRHMESTSTPSSSCKSSRSSESPSLSSTARAAKYSGGGWRGGTITAHPAFFKSKADAKEEFRISNASSGRAWPSGHVFFLP